jgi:hypothetical protein
MLLWIILINTIIIFWHIFSTIESRHCRSTESNLTFNCCSIHDDDQGFVAYLIPIHKISMYIFYDGRRFESDCQLNGNCTLPNRPYLRWNSGQSEGTCVVNVESKVINQIMNTNCSYFVRRKSTRILNVERNWGLQVLWIPKPSPPVNN